MGIWFLIGILKWIWILRMMLIGILKGIWFLIGILMMLVGILMLLIWILKGIWFLIGILMMLLIGISIWHVMVIPTLNLIGILNDSRTKIHNVILMQTEIWS